MDDIRQYILSVVAAAIISGLIIKLTEKKSSQGVLIKLLTGLFLAVTVISPWTKVKINNFSYYFDGLSDDASVVVAQGQDMADEAMCAIIKSHSETYILDKASSLGVDLEVNVSLSDADPPTPCAVHVKGSVSPYIKSQLKEIIAENIGIPEDDQIWT